MVRAKLFVIVLMLVTEAQARCYREMKAWSQHTNTTVFFFEAFDEPWKRDPNVLLGAEKHWGLLHGRQNAFVMAFFSSFDAGSGFLEP